MDLRGEKLGSAAAYRQACVDLALMNSPGIVVEVGVRSGVLSRKLLALPTLKRLFLVDSWEGATVDRQPPFFLPYNQQQMDNLAVFVKQWAAAYPHLTVLHMRSADAAPLFDDESVDFFHTDGDHTTEGVTSDISGWLPKVRRGGILSGDNYEMPSVRIAVDRLLPRRQLLANGRLWWARK